MSEVNEYELMKYVQSKGMVFLSTPFSRVAAERLEKFGVEGYKIGAGELNNYPLLDYIASFGKPMIFSTGMNDLEIVTKAVRFSKNARFPSHFYIRQIFIPLLRI